MPKGIYQHKPSQFFKKGNKLSVGKIPWNKGVKYTNSNWIAVVCNFCEKEFLVKPSRKNRVRYCSKDCMTNSQKCKKMLPQVREAIHKANVGSVPWNRGLTGIKTGLIGGTPWNKGKKRPEMTGENNFNWKGGVTSSSRKERILFGQTIRKLVLERDNYTCQICEARNGNGKNVYLEVDHIQPWAEYVEGRFSMNNCRTLCMACHYKITFNREMPETITRWGGGIKIQKC